MDPALNQAIFDFQCRRISERELVSALPFPPQEASVRLRSIVDDIIRRKSASDVESILILMDIFEFEDKFPDSLHKLILEPWHYSYENITHMLQDRMDPASIPFIRAAMHNKYAALEYTGGTGQFIGQCGHALWSIGTPEAIQVIKELSETSEDPIIRAEMTYRLRRIEAHGQPLQGPPLKRWSDFVP